MTIDWRISDEKSSSNGLSGATYLRKKFGHEKIVVSFKNTLVLRSILAGKGKGFCDYYEQSRSS